MPLSRLDLSTLRAAVADLYRILEDPTQTNNTVRRVYRWDTARTSVGAQDPEGKSPSAFIRAGVVWVMYHFGEHSRTDCPEITDAHLDLDTKTALLELRDELVEPFASHALSTNAGTRIRFLRFLGDILGRIDPAPAGKEQGEGGAPPAAKPDGPFDADGFRFARVDVRFGKAAKQFRLVMALWDAQEKRPAVPRPVDDVIREVWGDEHDTEDSTFRQLCADTRRRFQTASCPLDIKVTNGKVQLSPL